jgi:hypothetical protein
VSRAGAERRFAPRDALPVVAVLAAALVAAGCGGGSKPKVSQSLTTLPTGTTGTTTQPSPPGQPTKGKSSHRRHHATSGGSPAPAPTGTGKKRGKGIGGLPSGQRTNFIKTTVQTLLQGAGLQVLSVTVSPKGDTVNATVGASSACAAGHDATTQVIPRLRTALPGVRAVNVTVGGTGKSLASFVSSCPALRPPGGPGRVVLAQAGRSVSVTRQFTVRSRHWTVAYVNGSGSLQIVPLKGSKPVGQPFTVSSAGAGTHAFRGSGTFKLRIGTFGSWQVQVRDGG